jgi:hypothetical protein
MSRKVSLVKQKILDSWSVLIEGAQGRGEELIRKVVEYIEKSKAPNVRTEMVEAYPDMASRIWSSISKRLAREPKTYLMVSNDNLEATKIYVRAQDYGRNLFVCWYLITEPGLLAELLSAPSSEDRWYWVPRTRDVFTEEELTAYVTCIHHCVLRAVEDLMRSLGQDPSKIERKSRGFLGVS